LYNYETSSEIYAATTRADPHTKKGYFPHTDERAPATAAAIRAVSMMIADGHLNFRGPDICGN